VTPPDETRSNELRRVGRCVHVFRSIPSTNDAAAERPDADEGTVFVADHQSRGRGQHGRSWFARPGDALLASVVLRPPVTLARPVILTALAAVAVGDAIYDLTGAQARIKWPNDLLVRGRKICGILIESGRSTVIGIGLNLNPSAEDFAAANLPDATSLRIVRGAAVERDRALDAVLDRLDAEYARLLAGERAPLEADWKWRIGLLGRSVLAVRTDGESVGGRLLEMGFDGLEIQRPDGGMEFVQPETVRHLHAV
jgi:BirA family biotin operon repressor/biotin-[acetyl-CoA-carboxylase] ligase